jgi:hypothetical protein
MGHLSELFRKYKGSINSLQMDKKLRMAAVTQAGVNRGNIMEKKNLTGPQPSMMAASYNSVGIVSTNA